MNYRSPSRLGATRHDFYQSLSSRCLKTSHGTPPVRPCDSGSRDGPTDVEDPLIRSPVPSYPHSGNETRTVKETRVNRVAGDGGRRSVRVEPPVIGTVHLEALVERRRQWECDQVHQHQEVVHGVEPRREVQPALVPARARVRQPRRPARVVRETSWSDSRGRNRPWGVGGGLGQRGRLSTPTVGVGTP